MFLWNLFECFKNFLILFHIRLRFADKNENKTFKENLKYRLNYKRFQKSKQN